jgi:hypothetical protein
VQSDGFNCGEVRELQETYWRLMFHPVKTSFTATQIRPMSALFCPKRGAYASSRTRGGMRWTQQRQARKASSQGGQTPESLSRERCASRRTTTLPACVKDSTGLSRRSFGEDGCVRRSRVVLTPRCWRQVLRRRSPANRSCAPERSAKRRWHSMVTEETTI